MSPICAEPGSINAGARVSRCLVAAAARAPAPPAMDEVSAFDAIPIGPRYRFGRFIALLRGYLRGMAASEFTLLDEGGQGWSLQEHLQSNSVAIIFYRGDW